MTENSAEPKDDGSIEEDAGRAAGTSLDAGGYGGPGPEAEGAGVDTSGTGAGGNPSNADPVEGDTNSEDQVDNTIPEE